MRLFRVLIVSIVNICAVFSQLIAGPFDINQVPKGKSITLPPPALSVISLPATLTLKATDRKQTIKLSTLHSSGPSSQVKVGIFTAGSDRVRYVTLKPASPVIYTFSKLETIRLESQLVKEATKLSKMKMVLESNRPLQIIR
jgi:hypothetical protein